VWKKTYTTTFCAPLTKSCDNSTFLEKSISFCSITGVSQILLTTRPLLKLPPFQILRIFSRAGAVPKARLASLFVRDLYCRLRFRSCARHCTAKLLELNTVIWPDHASVHRINLTPLRSIQLLSTKFKVKSCLKLRFQSPDCILEKINPFSFDLNKSSQVSFKPSQVANFLSNHDTESTPKGTFSP